MERTFRCKMHENELVNYLRYSRLARQKKLKIIKECFQDFIDSRVMEDTFTNEEVQDLLSNLSLLVCDEVESELLNSSHANLLMLQQLFLTAEAWHLKMELNFSELEDRDLLKEISEIEVNEVLLSRRTSSLPAVQSSPDAGPVALLHQKISSLQSENENLKLRAASLESQLDLTRLSSKPNSAPTALPAAPAEEKREKEVHNSPEKKPEESRLPSDDNQNAVTSLMEELDCLRKEMNTKIQETSQFKNMMKLLDTKNKQLKELRVRISQLERNE